MPQVWLAKDVTEDRAVQQPGLGLDELSRNVVGVGAPWSDRPGKHHGASNGRGRATGPCSSHAARAIARPQATEAPGENGTHADDSKEVTAAAAKGLNLPFDVVRRFPQPTGIDLDGGSDPTTANVGAENRIL